MDALLAQLRAAAEPTRLRLLSLCARGDFRVSDLVAILGQSQPRLSRHLKLLAEAGLLERIPEGANAYFRLADGADLARALLARLPEDDPAIAADRRAAARLAAERARAASESFRRHGADWDEFRALGLDASAIADALREALPARVGRLLDIGTGTGAVLEWLAERSDAALGVDASRDMLALARARLAERGLSARCAVRQADMYRLPFPDASFDAATLQMVLHYADDPAAALAEAARVLKPGGALVIVDLAVHDDASLLDRHAHRWPGFDDAALAGWFGAAGCAPVRAAHIESAAAIRLWSATRQPVPVPSEASA
jgi:SAM-dependent methyltransferase